jgi:4a-hydroxytetrahydrobiopterin dehydratase
VAEPVLADAEVIAALSADGGPDWHLIAGKLVKTVVCADFVSALAYVEEVGRRAEAANHHPDIDIRYNRVSLALMTHDSGGLTRRDLDLAREIDGIATAPTGD